MNSDKYLFDFHEKLADMIQYINESSCEAFILFL